MRLDLGLFAVSLLAFSCDSVLGISEPEPRMEGDAGAGSPHVDDGGQSGEAGDGNAAGAETGGTAGAAGGAAGASPQPAAGQGGHDEPGLAGAGGAASCGLGEKRCGGELDKTPEICNEAGEWVVDSTENEGDDCPLLCVGGTCQDCIDDDKQCDGNVPQICEDGVWQDGTLCKSYCLAGECRNPPSCAENLSCADSVSCCRAFEVEGGTFVRNYDGIYLFDDGYTATLSSFLMDEFEVTVGRLRNFVTAYSSIVLKDGDGAAPHIAGDLGWRESFPLPADVEALKVKLACEGTTWNDDPLQTDARLPANCVDFYIAYAFCIWDGGRLPTEAEWNYAAAGGDEQRVYPWSDPPTSELLSVDHACYEESSEVPLPVGSKSLGNGRWGHADLAGNVYEWELDYFADIYPSDHCADCLVSTGSELRSLRGGGFKSSVEEMWNVLRTSHFQDQARDSVGFRCVRDIERAPSN